MSHLYDLPKDILVKLIATISEKKDEEILKKNERIKHLQKLLKNMGLDQESGVVVGKCHYCSDKFYNACKWVFSKDNFA
jgi:hypothetical protein